MGHTHEKKVQETNGIYLINPGSMTGAYSSMNPHSTPSFMILEIKTNEIMVYDYTLLEGELNCDEVKIKLEWLVIYLYHNIKN